MKDDESMAGYLSGTDQFYINFLKERIKQKYHLAFVNTITSESQSSRCNCETDIEIQNTNFRIHKSYSLIKTDDGKILISE